MIHCPKCGADNMVGAIFCRTCQARLDLDSLRPESFTADQRSLRKKIGAIVQRLLILALVLAGCAVLGAAFWPARGQMAGAETDKERLTALLAKYERMKTPGPRRYWFAYTSEEASAILNHIFELTPKQKVPDEEERIDQELPNPKIRLLMPRQIRVMCEDDGTIRLVMKAGVFGLLPIYTKLLLRPAVESGGAGVNVDILAAHIGKIPMVKDLSAIVSGPYAVLLADRAAGPDLQNIGKTVQKLEIGEDSIRLTLKYR